MTASGHWCDKWPGGNRSPAGPSWIAKPCAPVSKVAHAATMAPGPGRSAHSIECAQQSIPAVTRDLGRWRLRWRPGAMGTRTEEVGQVTAGDCAQARRAAWVCRLALAVDRRAYVRLARTAPSPQG